MGLFWTTSILICLILNSFEGKKEGTILENSAYYILTQCPDGVFEAVPIQAWYTFQPKINYQTLSLDDAERELSKRDKTINYHNLMMQKRLQASEENNEEQRVGDKVSSTFRDDLVSSNFFSTRLFIFNINYNLYYAK